MKKIFKIMTLCLFMLGLSGCGEDSLSNMQEIGRASCRERV